MTAVVRLALARPYTFVVMAILVMIFGVLSAIRTPTDIFPNIGIQLVDNLFDRHDSFLRREHCFLLDSYDPLNK